MATNIHLLANLFSFSAKAPSAFEASISALEASIKILESSIDSLAKSSGPWEVFGWGCSIVVGIAVAVEIVGIVWEYREDRKAWSRGIVREPDHPNRVRFWMDVIATVFVVVGIFGEAASSQKLASINSLLGSKTSELRAKSDQLLALITQEAGTAKNSAIAAQVAAGTAQAKSDAVGRTADSLVKKAALAEAAQMELQKQLAIQQEKTAHAETARLQMLEAIKPRQVGTSGAQNDELALFAGTKFFITFASDSDSQELSGNIVEILQRAEWNLVGSEAYPFSPMSAQPPKIIGGRNLNIVGGTGLFDGVIVMAKPADWNSFPGRTTPAHPDLGNAASILCYVLKDSNVACDTFPRYRRWPDGLPDDSVWIVVGKKPAAYLQWANDPEAQKAFTEMEKKNQINSADDQRNRASILARKRSALRGGTN